MKKLVYLLILVFAIQSCSMELEEEITWDIEPYPDMLVVESVITNENKQQAVFLTIANSYFDAGLPKSVRNAIVKVTEGSNIYTFTESSTIQGLYLSDTPFACIPLHTYSLSVTLSESMNGLKDYTATSFMNEGVDIDTIICEIYEMPEFNFEEENNNEEKDTTVLALVYFGNEPKSTGNYYLNKVFRNNKPLQATPKEYSIYDDSYSNGEYVHFSTYGKNVAAGDTIRLRLYSIEKSFYKFIEGIQLIDQTGDAYSMSGPPANAIGNISDGKALGFFATAYISEKTTIAIDRR